MKTQVAVINGGSRYRELGDPKSLRSIAFILVLTIVSFGALSGTNLERYNVSAAVLPSTAAISPRFVNPQINSISPASLIATVGNQNVAVFGNNFLSGLTVTVFFPSGRSGTLSGSQIQHVTSTSFVMVIDFNGNRLVSSNRRFECRNLFTSILSCL